MRETTATLSQFDKQTPTRQTAGIREAVKRKKSKSKFYKIGVINDPLGQPTFPAGSDCRLILKFWDGRTDGRTDLRTRTYVRTDGHSV